MKKFIPSLFYGKKSAHLQPKKWKKFSLSKGLHSGLYALKNKSPHFLCRFRSTLNTSKSHLLQFVYIRKANKKRLIRFYAWIVRLIFYSNPQGCLSEAALKTDCPNRFRGFKLFAWNLKVNTFSIDLTSVKWYNIHV